MGGSVGAGVFPPPCPLRHDVSVRLFHQQQFRHSLLLVLFVPIEHGKYFSK